MRWNILSQFSQEKTILDALLENRSMKTEEEKEAFLNPPKVTDLLEKFSSEFKKSVEEAAGIITSTMSAGRPIIIHGDYDADGICATAILYRTIKNELGYSDVHSFIPDRFDHGYGLSSDSVDAVAEIVGEIDGALLITVDTGITSNEEVNYAKEMGFKVIIADHHQKPKNVPKADVIVWNEDMVGSGVSWSLAREIGSEDERLLGLVGLATVTDLQPLLGFNRSVVKEGLEILNSNPLPGVKVLHEVAGRKGLIGTYDLGWVIGPRLNAAGRIGSASLGLSLLLEDDKEAALGYVRQLNDLNILRQEKTQEMYELAATLHGDETPRVIISASQDYHEGIIGLVAAKLVQEHYRPAIVISLDGEFAKGSVRSVKGVDIISMLREFEDLFENVGGHPMAAGFTVQASRLDELAQRVGEFAESYVLDEYLVPVIDVDMEIPLETVDLEFARNLSLLSPFGIGNKEPTFLSRKLGVTGFDEVGRNSEHLSLKLLAGGKIFKAIWFGGVEKMPQIEVGGAVDLVYKVEEKEFNGRTYVDLIVRDLKISE